MVSPVRARRPLVGALCVSALAAVLWWGCAAPPVSPEEPAGVELTAQGPVPGPPPTGGPPPTLGAEGTTAPGLPPTAPPPGPSAPTVAEVTPAPPPTGEVPPGAPAPPTPPTETPAEGSTVPPVPPGLGVLIPALTPALEAVGEEPTSPLWVSTDEFGTVAQTEKSFVLFYPLRYHGGFTAIATESEIERVKALTVKPVPLNQIELATQLKNVLGVEVTNYSSLNMLVIKVPLVGKGDTLGTRQLEQVKELLRLLDAPRKQVSIEAKIVEISRELETQLGVDWGVANTTGTFRTATGNFDIPGSTRFGTSDFNVDFDTGPASHLRLEATLRALEGTSDLEVISEPSMVVEVGQTARVLVGQEIPLQSEWKGRAGSTSITTKLKEVGVRLLVTPLTVSDDTIRLQVWAEVSDVQEFRVTGEGVEAPVINTRNAQTTVSVRDGEYIKIAGLISKDKVKTEVKVPLLGDIPFLGFFFKNWRYQTVDRDLLIFITPRIIRGPLIQLGGGSFYPP